MARKKQSLKPNKTMLIVTPTEAAALYFSQMRKDCRYANLNVTVLPGCKTLEEFVLKTARLRSRGGHALAWAVFGFDDFQDATVDEVKRLEPIALGKKVKLGWSNPCQDLWYLLHFTAPTAVITDPAAFGKALPAYVPGYQDGAKWLLTDGLSFHLQLFPNKSKAVANSTAYNMLAEGKTGLAATNLLFLLNDITEICGEADITHNQRQLSAKH